MKKLRHFFIGDYLTKTDDVFERARIELTFDYSVFFWILGVAFYGNLIANHLVYHTAVISFACVALLSIPFILKYKQSVKIAAYWYVAQQLITSCGSVFIEEARPNIAGGFWTLSFIMYAMFIFGVRKGLLIAIPFIAFFGLSIYSILVGKQFDWGIPKEQQLTDQPIFLLVPFFLCLYIVATFIRTRKNAENMIQQQKSLLEEKNKEVKDSIEYAQRIQKAILPSQRLIENYLPGSFFVYLPKDIVSGDFYWVEKKDHKIFFAVADCTGHGVPGAMMSVICQNALNRVLNEFHLTKPAEMLEKLNLLVEESFSKSGADIRDGMDIALCAFDPVSKQLEYAGANNSLYHISNNALNEFKGTKQPIGRFESKIPFAGHSVKLNSGDCIYLFSDGIADQFGGPQGKKFKYKRVKEILLKNSGQSNRDQKNHIVEEFFAWKGKLEQVDDVCVMGMKV